MNSACFNGLKGVQVDDVLMLRDGREVADRYLVSWSFLVIQLRHGLEVAPSLFGGYSQEKYYLCLWIHMSVEIYMLY